MNAPHDDPWLTIPLSDYEGHMEAVGQTAALRRAFADVYGSVKPTRLAVLGCTSGGDFDLLDPDGTEMAVGVDINPAYVEAAQQRHPRVQFLCADVLKVTLSAASFDLIHAALLLEYVQPRPFFDHVRGWLRPSGRLSIVSQEPSETLAAVSQTSYPSLLALGPRMSLHPADQIVAEAARTGFALASQRRWEMPNGKVLTHSLFRA